MRGTIVIDNQAGRALRKKCAAVLSMHVIDCAGSFRAGDPVYVSFRGKDGGQYVVATGIVRCDEKLLQQIKGRSPDIRADAVTLEPVENDPGVVIREQDLQLRWPPSSGID